MFEPDWVAEASIDLGSQHLHDAKWQAGNKPETPRRFALGTRDGVVFTFSDMTQCGDWATLGAGDGVIIAHAGLPACARRGLGGDAEVRISEIAWVVELEPRKPTH